MVGFRGKYVKRGNMTRNMVNILNINHVSSHVSTFHVFPRPSTQKTDHSFNKDTQNLQNMVNIA